MSGTRLVTGLGLALTLTLALNLSLNLGLTLTIFLFFTSINIYDTQALCRHYTRPKERERNIMPILIKFIILLCPRGGKMIMKSCHIQW